MTELKIFNSEEFGEIRTVTVNNEPMFCLTDVCRALGIVNVGNAKSRLSEKGIRSMDTLTSGGTQKLLYISEPNLYKTIFQSRKKSAERFTDWVTGEVLPSIRKTGSYQKPMTTNEKIQAIAQGYSDLSIKVNKVETDLQNFKQTLPLLAVDCEVITNAVRKRAMSFLGGKQTNAYRNAKLRAKVYSDLHREVKHQFGVNTYKALHRDQMDIAVGFIEKYELPFVLLEAIKDANAQMTLDDLRSK